MSFHPYLNFDGTCRDAFEWYGQIFGGELLILDAEGAPEVPEGFEGRTMHASLTLPNGGLLMGSDTTPGGHPKPQGLYVTYTAPDLDNSRAVWAALKEGATYIGMEFEETFFSPGFGELTDRFGTPWLIDTAYPTEE